MKRAFAVVFTLALSAMSSACVSVLPEAKPPAPRYVLSPVEFATQGPEVSWSLAVEDPSATRVYDTTKIAALREPGRVEFFMGGEWADRGSRLVQTALVRSFENSGRILAVGDRIDLPAANFILNTDIRALDANYETGAPVAEFAVFARVTDGQGKVIAVKLFRRSVPAAANTVPEVAKALNEAVSAALAEIVEWTFATGEAAKRS
jgi:cholesterol transport system auxiliary component